MKRLLKLFAVLAILMSCAPQIQLVTLKSSGQKLVDSNLIYQDSLLKISYDFYSPNGTLRFKVTNCYSKPIFIDWKNSMYLTASGTRISYWNDVAKINGNIHSTSVDLTSWLSTSSASVNANIKQDERVAFLPPATETEIKKFRISNGRAIAISSECEIINEKDTWHNTKKPAKIKLYKFNPENSPIKFRNYLTVALTEDFKEPIYYDFEFWASDIKEMNVKQLVGNSLYHTYMNSTMSGSKFHPYKQKNRFFIIDDKELK